MPPAYRNHQCRLAEYTFQGQRVLFLENEFLRVGERGIRTDRHRIDHHSRFELLDLVDLFGLLDRRQIPMNDTDAARLRHGNGKPSFGNRVHGCRNDWNVQFDVARNQRANICLTRHNLRMTGLQQHVIEGESLRPGCGFNDRGHRQTSNKGTSASTRSGNADS